ncbi:MAG: branched-chain amino acid ABC transporter permease [Trueperaceae bacterium]|nr:branched-chain amino acid ABC transporter permease [Trueperaceae bacterium]
MSASYFIQQLINGLAIGSLYALVAVGLSMVYGILRLINFAHGDLMMIAGMLGATLFLWLSKSPLFLFVALALVAGLLGLALERIAYRPLRGAPEVNLLITSFAVSSILQVGMQMIFSSSPRRFETVAALSKLYSFGSVQIRGADMATFFITILSALLLTWFTRRTRTGIAMRAVSENLDTSMLMGINPSRPIALAFFIGSLLAGVAGVLWGWKYGQVDPLFGFLPGLKAFVAAVIGGIGSIPGAFVGGYVLGLAEVFFVGFLPPSFSGYRDVFVFSLLFIVLLVKPQGILGQSKGRRA